MDSIISVLQSLYDVLKSFVNSLLKYSYVRNDVIICKSKCKYLLYLYRKKHHFLLFHVVYKYCYFDSNMFKIYVKESVTDIMKHPVHVNSNEVKAGPL